MNSQSSEIDLPLDELCTRSGAGFGGSPNNEKYQALLSARLNQDLIRALTVQTTEAAKVTAALNRQVEEIRRQSAANEKASELVLAENRGLRIATVWMVVLTGLMTLATFMTVLENWILAKSH